MSFRACNSLVDKLFEGSRSMHLVMVGEKVLMLVRQGLMNCARSLFKYMSLYAGGGATGSEA